MGFEPISVGSNPTGAARRYQMSDNCPICFDPLGACRIKNCPLPPGEVLRRSF